MAATLKYFGYQKRLTGKAKKQIPHPARSAGIRVDRSGPLSKQDANSCGES